MRIFIGVFSVLFLLCHVPALASSFGIRKDGKLDKPALNKAYRESDWDDVCKTLERYLGNKDTSRIDVDERIFAYKHLGVIYAADWNTQTRAESYFNQLLELSPDIEIVDMYVSKKIRDFFRDVKLEYKKQKAYSSNYDEFGRKVNGPAVAKAGPGDSQTGQEKPRPTSKPKEAKIDQSGGQSWVWWTVGLLAATGIGVGAYYMSQDKVQKRDSVVTDIEPDK